MAMCHTGVCWKCHRWVAAHHTVRYVRLVAVPVDMEVNLGRWSQAVHSYETLHIPRRVYKRVRCCFAGPATSGVCICQGQGATTCAVGLHTLVICYVQPSQLVHNLCQLSHIGSCVLFRQVWSALIEQC